MYFAMPSVTSYDMVQILVNYFKVSDLFTTASCITVFYFVWSLNSNTSDFFGATGLLYILNLFSTILRIIVFGFYVYNLGKLSPVHGH